MGPKPKFRSYSKRLCALVIEGSLSRVALDNKCAKMFRVFPNFKFLTHGFGGKEEALYITLNKGLGGKILVCNNACQNTQEFRNFFEIISIMPVSGYAL